jgi:hypothetical protein
LRRSPYGPVTAFLDATHAWVAVDNSVVPKVIGQSKSPTTLRLFFTADGGRHWQALPLLRLGMYYYAGTLSFLSRVGGDRPQRGRGIGMVRCLLDARWGRSLAARSASGIATPIARCAAWLRPVR